jgi:hypothetical protein
MAWFSDALSALRKFDSLMRVERKHGALINALDKRQRRPEAREEVVIAKAEAAAASAASAVASHHIGDMARRRGGLEERVAQLERSDRQRPRLPPGPT